MDSNATEEYIRDQLAAMAEKHIDEANRLRARVIALESVHVSNLGLARTRELLEELAVRFEITTPHPVRAEKLRDWIMQLSNTTLDYRPVDGHG